jgi:hypothetical protein
MTRTDLCAAGDGLITWTKLGVWDPGGWEHDDGTRFRDGHLAQPIPQCPKCGSAKVTFEAANPWTERCLKCGTTIDATSKEMT